MQWAIDAVLSNNKIIRAEYCKNTEFNCDDDGVMAAYKESTMYPLMVSPINVAPPNEYLLVSYDDPISLAGLVIQTLMNERELNDATFYGEGYMEEEEQEDDEPGATDLMGDAYTFIKKLPESKFGFVAPEQGTKSLVDTLYATARKEIEDEISFVKSEIYELQKAKSPWSRQPQRKYFKAIVDHYTPQMAKALRNGVSGVPAAIAEAKKKYDAEMAKVNKASGNAANRLPSEIASAQIANAAVRGKVTITPEDARKVLNYIWADAYTSGAHSAKSQIGAEGAVPSAVEAVEREIDWEIWGPGESAAANLIRDGGLEVLLEDSDVTIRGIFDTVLDRLGNAIAYGLDNGLPASQIADNISTVDPVTGEPLVSDHADMIAITETSRAQGQATMDTYIANGIEEYDWMAEDDACDKPLGNNCKENEAEGPYEVSPLPDPRIPQHPNCRCTYLPVIPVDQPDEPNPNVQAVMVDEEPTTEEPQ